MFSPLVRGSRFTQIVMITAFSGLILSCTIKQIAPNASSAPVVTIQDIRVTEGTEKTMIEIESEEPMIYTTFRLSDPDRLVIDMADVSLAQFSGDIFIEGGPVRSVRPGKGEGRNISRLEFELSGEVETDVRTEGSNLLVEATQVAKVNKGFVFFEDESPAEPQDIAMKVSDTLQEPIAPSPLTEDMITSPDMPEMSSEMASDDALSDVQGQVVLVQSISMPVAEAVLEKPKASKMSVKAPVSLSDAKKISSVEFEKGEDLKLIVRSDGVLKPRAFFMGSGDKKRLVIDLPDVKMTSFKRHVAIEDHRVKQVRIGQHAKKLRLVLDLMAPVSYTLSQVGEDLNILLKDPSESESKPAVLQSAKGKVQEGDQGGEDIAEMKVAPEVAPIKDLNEQGVAAVSEKVVTEEASLNLEEKTLVLSFPSLALAEAATFPSALPVALSTQDAGDSNVQEADEAMTAALEEVEKTEHMPEEKIAPQQDGTSFEKKGSVESPVDLPKMGSDTPEEKMLEDSVPALVSDTSMEEKEMTPEMTGKQAESPEDVLMKEIEEKEAKKKILLRRKRREAAKSKREALSLANAAAEVSLDTEPPKYIGRKISLDFQDAEITNVVRLIADVSGLNFVMGDDITGKITINMDDVPWDQALEIILEIRNLGMVRDGNIIRIATLSNLSKQRNEKAQAMETKIRAEELMTRVLYVNYAKAEQMKTLLQKLLTTRGEIMVASRVNALVVKDVEANVDQVEEMAKKLDTKTPQVLIEARIVEVQPSFKRSLGVKWGADFKTNNGGNSFGIGNATGDSGVFNQGPDFAVNLPAANPLGGIGFSFGRFTESPFQLDLRISAGESQEMTRIVSTPKIMVLDNNEALIKQGSQIPFQSSSANGGNNIQLIDASLQLKVIPHISPDGGILLELDLTKNEPGPPVQGSSQPSIFEKEVNTQVLLMNGETMVIGGIYETKSTESEAGIPILKDIPGLGWLFKSKDTSESTTELLIFITPTVME